ncbi:MAG: hypothetical protein WC465_01305 [Patescibacteria group bacterium]
MEAEYMAVDKTQETPEPPKMGISFETPLGEVYREIDLHFPEKDLSVRTAFPDLKDLREIIKKARDFQIDSPGTFNGVLLGNPIFRSAEDGKMVIDAERLHYFVYFAAHQLRQENPATFGEKYGALSICGVVYDRSRNCFYLSVRPSASQEEGGKIDAPGGVLNPDFENADPFATAKDRFRRKLGLEIPELVSVGVERIYDQHYSLHDIAMYAEVDNQMPTVDSKQFAEINLADLETMIRSDKLTGPAKATLLLALAQPQFANLGWDAQRIEQLLTEINKPHDNKE